MLLWSAFKRQTVGVQNTVVVLILCFVWWLYVCLGAAIIQALETPVQKRHLGKVAKFVASFLENHKCVSGEQGAKRFDAKTRIFDQHGTMEKQGRIHGHQLRTGGQGRKCAFSHFLT